MAMRDPKEMAREWMSLVAGHPDDYDETAVEQVASLIRAAQEDGARGATCPHCGPGTDLNTALNKLADERVALGWARESIARLEAKVTELEDARVSRFDGLMDQLDEARAAIKEMHTRIVDVEARESAQVAALTERAERAGEQAKGWRERARAAETRVRDLKSAGFAEVADIGEWPISSERKDAVFRLARERDESRQENEKLKEFAGLCL